MLSEDTAVGLAALVFLGMMALSYWELSREKKEEQITFDILACPPKARPVALGQLLAEATNLGEVDQIVRDWVCHHFGAAKRWWKAWKRGLTA